MMLGRRSEGREQGKCGDEGPPAKEEGDKGMEDSQEDACMVFG